MIKLEARANNFSNHDVILELNQILLPDLFHIECRSFADPCLIVLVAMYCRNSLGVFGNHINNRLAIGPGYNEVISCGRTNFGFHVVTLLFKNSCYNGARLTSLWCTEIVNSYFWNDVLITVTRCWCLSFLSASRCVRALSTSFMRCDVDQCADI